MAASEANLIAQILVAKWSYTFKTEDLATDELATSIPVGSVEF